MKKQVKTYDQGVVAGYRFAALHLEQLAWDRVKNLSVDNLEDATRAKHTADVLRQAAAELRTLEC